MRTVYLINLSYGIAGIEKRFLNIWKELKRRGNIRPILVIPDTQANLFAQAGMLNLKDRDLWLIKENPLIREICKPRFNTVLLNNIVSIIRARFMAIGYFKVWRKIRKEENALIHMGLNCSALFPPMKPIVYECVDSTFKALRKGHYQRAAKRRSVINCQTERIEKELLRLYESDNTSWVTEVSPMYFADYTQLDKYPNKKDPRLILFVGRMSPEKNPELLVDAANVLRKNGVSFSMEILGEGPLLQRVKNRISEYELNDVVKIGFSKTPAEYYSRSQIFISIQSGDNYGSQSLLEAMAAQCAVIATKAGETKRIINQSNGILVEPDAEELAKAIRWLLDNPEETAKLAQNGADLVRSVYTANSYAAYLEGLYLQAENIFNEK